MRGNLQWGFRNLGRLRLLLAALLPVAMPAMGADQPTSRQALWKKLEPFTRPPPEFEGQLGPYRSPLLFADNTVAKTPADWAKRRDEILNTWQKRLGAWPPLVERPAVKRLEAIKHDGYTSYRVQLQIAPEGMWAEGYLLIPNGSRPLSGGYRAFLRVPHQHRPRTEWTRCQYARLRPTASQTWLRDSINRHARLDRQAGR